MSDEQSLHPFEREIAHLSDCLLPKLNQAGEAPHSGLRGARIEGCIADFLRKVLPRKYDVATNQIIVDCEGKVSRECDIVIFDAANHMRLMHSYIPIEVVYGVIEIKKTLDHGAAADFREKVKSFRRLNFRGHYSNWTETRLKEQKFSFEPPSYNLLAVQTKFKNFEQFCAECYVDPFGNDAFKPSPLYTEALLSYRSICGSLDMGTANNCSIVHQSFFAIGGGGTSPKKIAHGKEYRVSQPKALYLFLSQLEAALSSRELVVPFDNRSYLNFCRSLSDVFAPDKDELMRRFEELNSRSKKASEG